MGRVELWWVKTTALRFSCSFPAPPIHVTSACLRLRAFGTDLPPQLLLPDPHRGALHCRLPRHCSEQFSPISAVAAWGEASPTLTWPTSRLLLRGGAQPQNGSSHSLARVPPWQGPQEPRPVWTPPSVLPCPASCPGQPQLSSTSVIRHTPALASRTSSPCLHPFSS